LQRSERFRPGYEHSRTRPIVCSEVDGDAQDRHPRGNDDYDIGA
jgi:hypothetical protein